MKNAKNSTLFNYAYLSAASYSDLVDALNGNGAVKKETSIEEAIGLFMKKEIGSELTNWIKSNYKVMSQWRDSNNSNYNDINERAILENKDNSGFSATLFRAKDDYKSNTSKYILAFRGTKGPGDIFKTDVGDIVLDGLAYEQIIDLYNYWQQLRTEKGKTYKAAYVYDIEKELEALKKQELDLSTAIDKQQEVALIRKKIKEIKDIEESNKFFSFHELSSKKIHDDDSATFLGKFYIDFRDSSEVYKNKEHIYGLGLLSNDDKIDIAGHSLGGHLAMAFYRLFPEVVEHAWGFNGAGYGKKDNPKNFFEVLSKAKGDVYSNNKGIINLIGSKGPNFVTNNVYLRQPLEHYESFTEDWSIAGGGVLGHGMMPMAQTAAVLSLFASLDSNLDKMSIKDFLEKMNPLLEISSSDDDVTIETILNKLSLQLTGNNPNLTEGNDSGIYNTIAILQDIISGSKDRENLLGKLKLFVNLPQNNNNLILKANTKEGIAERYALKHLNPFTLEGDILYKEKLDNSVLYTTNGMLKQDLTKLQLFDSNDKHTFAGMSTEYIAQRADMLKLTMESNWDELSKTLNNTVYIDIDANIAVTNTVIPDKNIYDTNPPHTPKPGNTGVTERKKVVFGSEDDKHPDILTGGKLDDFLFAGAGDDTMEGKEGKDHLEGGIGKDAYIVKEEDIILDTDNDGEIFFNEKTEANCVHYFVYDEKKKEWYSSDENGKKDEKYIASRVSSSNSLKITKVGGKDSVEIKDYFRNGNDKLDGSLGLETVPEKVEEEPLPPSSEVKEFIITPPAKRGHNDFYLGFDSYQVNGTKYNDTIYGRTARQGKGGVGIYAPMGGGNDLAYGSWYDDVIDGGDDTDIIYGSEPGGYITQKRSRADKDKDGDTIVGGAGSDFLFGMAGKDFIFGGSRTEHEETKPVAGQGDWANGGDGNDHIFGSAAQDVLQGGKGQDEIKGGAGDDLIIGDSDVMPNVKIMRGGASDGLPTFLHKYNFKTHQMDKPEIYYTVNQLAKATAEWKIEIAANNRDYRIIRSTERLPELAGERSTMDDLPANSDASALPGSDNDTLEGGPGNDFILGQHGSDFINGGSGNDIIYGDDRSSLGSEEVYYNDHLIGGSGSDYLNGGRGADNYYFIREDFQPEKDGDAVPTDIIDDNGTGNIGVSGGRHDAIYLDKVDIAAMQWVRDGKNNIWNTADGWRIAYTGSTLQITHKDEAGKINVLNFANGDYGLNLSDLPNNGGNPPQPDPNPQPQPNPNPPTPPTPPTKRSPKTGKAVAAQRVNEKSPLNFALPDSAFTNPDNVALSYTATLADGKALPKWLHFDAAKRTFSGTPGNDDVGNLSIRVTAADGRGGSAMQNFVLEVVNVNDAPQIGTALANQQGKGGQAWQYRLPANAFRDIDKGDVLTLSAKLDNGQPLPSWLKFDGKTGQFSATLPKEAKASAYRIAVTATDKAGAQARQAFNLSIAAAPLNRIQGTAGSDNLQGTDGADYISGYAGNDRLEGKDGNDIIEGGLDNDSLVGGKGDDIYRFSGQFGNDGIYNFDIANYDYRTDRCDIIEFTDRKRSDVTIMRIGNNLLLRTQDGQSVSVYDNFSNKGKNSHYINFIRFSDMTLSADDIKAILQNGTSGDDHLYAKPEGSVLYAGAGNDTIIGNIGNDNLFGEDGNDTLRGNAGDDYLRGEDGNDALYGDAGKDYLDGGNGNDKLYGGADNDRLFGDRGNDVLFGGDGDDTLDGSDGDDLLYGEAGHDDLFGSSGNDVLNGGTGNDKLSGYEGNDVYQFNGNFGQDIIQNKNNQNMLFGSQYDRIDFTDLQQQDLIFRRSGNNLLLVSKKHANNQVTVLDHFRDNGKTAARIDEIRFADGSRLDYDAINRLVQSNNNPPRANLVQDRYAAEAARQAQVLTQAMAASGAQPLDNLMTPDNPPVPPLLPNLKP